MFNYCVTFNIYDYFGKTKIDYGIVPCELPVKNGKSYISKSLVSNEKIENLKKRKNCFVYSFKKDKQLYYRTVFSTKKEMNGAEFEWLPKIQKKICNQLGFRFKIKSELKNRIKRILGS